MYVGDQMRAVVLDGGRVGLRTCAIPEPAAHEVLVRVRSAALNAADLTLLSGAWPARMGPPPAIPGLEVAGEVVALGDDVRRVAVGDRVMAIVPAGGHAEWAVVDEAAVLAVPASVGWTEAGAFPEAFTVAHDALRFRARLRAGERVLVHGAAGGIGTAAVQLAVASGASVTATVRDRARHVDVGRLGADVVAPEDVAGTGPHDVVVEVLGAAGVAADVRSLRHGGRVVVIGLATGSTVELDLPELMRRCGAVVGVAYRPRSREEKATVTASVGDRVVPLLGRGAVRVPVAASFGLEEAPAAYRRFAAGGKFGKVVLVADGRGGGP